MANLPAFLQQVTNTHVKRWKEHRHEIGYGHLYQERYKCFPVETEDYFYQVVPYVERNALRANLVERAESWRWSSLRRVEREDPAFPVLSTWPLPRPTDWLQIVNQPQTEAEVAALRAASSAVGPSAIPTGSRTRPSDWGWNGRFGLEEGRRNNHKACHSYLCSSDLVAVTFHHPGYGVPGTSGVRYGVPGTSPQSTDEW